MGMEFMAILCYGTPLHQEDRSKLPWNQEETDHDLWWQEGKDFPSPEKGETSKQRIIAIGDWKIDNPLPAIPLPYGTPSEVTEVLAIPSTVKSVDFRDGYKIIDEDTVSSEEKRTFFEFCNKYGITGSPEMILMTYIW